MAERSRTRTVWLVAGALGIALVPVSAAVAAPEAEPTVVTGQHLQLLSQPDPAMAAMSPGQTASWEVGVRVLTPDPGTVEASLEVVSATPSAFDVVVERCLVPWDGSSCDDGAAELAGLDAVAGARVTLETLPSDAEPWYRVSVTRTAGAAAGPSGTDPASATLRLYATGAGDEVSVGPEAGTGAVDRPRPALPEGTLPGTGVTVPGALLLAAGAIALGLGLARGAGRHRSERPTSRSASKERPA